MADLTPKELEAKVRKIIEVYSSTAIINRVYFSPLFIEKLFRKVPELKHNGFRFSRTETEEQDGAVISVVLRGPEEDVSLGTVLLDGSKIMIEKSLVPVDKLLLFIRESLEPEQELNMLSKDEVDLRKNLFSY